MKTLTTASVTAVLVVVVVTTSRADMPSKDTGWCTDRQGNAVRCSSGGSSGGGSGGGGPQQPPPPSPQELGVRAYNEGIGHYRAGRFPDAEAAFRKAVELIPGDADARYALGLALSQQVTPQRWQRVLGLIRKSPHWSTQEDELLRAAIASYLEAEKRGHRTVGAELARVRALMAEYEATLAESRKAQAVRDAAWNEHYEGRRLGDAGRWKEAEERFRRAARTLPYDFGANTTNPYYMLAVSLQNQNKLADAVAAYEAVLRHEPTHARAREWLAFTKAAVAERDGDFRTMESYARQAIAVNAGNAGAHAKLGWALYKQNSSREAEASLREAVRLTPNVTARRLNLAAVLIALGKTADVERELREVLRIDPANADARKYLEVALLNDAGRARFASNDVEAERVLRRLLAEVPASAEARASLADVLLKRADSAEKRPAVEAERLYREVLALAPGSARAQNNLGVLLQSQGKLAAAESAYREAIRLEPGNDQGYRNLALVLEQQGRRQEVPAVYQALVRAKPGDAAVQRTMGAETAGRVNRVLGALTAFPASATAGADTGGTVASGAGPAPTGSTIKQLGSAGGHAGAITTALAGPVAGTEGLVADARRAFDLPPTLRGDVPMPVLQGMPRFRDPVLPERLRSDPAATQLVAKREAAKETVVKLEQELTALQQQPRTPDSDVQIARAKQAVSNAEQRVHVYTAALEQMVDLSFTSAPAGHASDATGPAPVGTGPAPPGAGQAGAAAGPVRKP